MKVFYKRHGYVKVLLSFLLAGGVAPLASADTFTLLPGIPNGMSPDGKTIVGNKTGGTVETDPFSSFMFTVGGEDVVWMTKYDEQDLSKGGLFNSVSDNGIIVGAVKNPNLRLPEEEDWGGFRPKRAASAENTGLPTTTAAVWRDGKLHILDIAEWNAIDFEDTLDGSYATGVSPDGAVVVGYIRASWYVQTPCYWYWDQAKEEYVFGLFPLGENCPVGQPRAFSPSTAVLVGTVSCLGDGEGADVLANIWTGPEETAILNLPPIGTPYYSSAATAISANGRYVGVNASGPVCYTGIYDRQENKYTRVNINTEATESEVLAVTDDGSAFIRTRIDGNLEYYFYDLKSGTLVTQSYYFKDVAPEIANQLANVVISGVSGDGKTIIGRSGSSAGIVVTLDDPQMLTVEAPTDVNLTHTAPGVLSLTWNGVEEVPEGTVLKGYKAIIGFEDKFYPATEPGGSFEWVLEGVERGGHIANVYTVFEKGGDEFLSPASKTVTSYASEETSDNILETFDDASAYGQMDYILNNDFWTIDAEGPGTNEIVRWHLTLDDFDNRSLVMQMFGVATQEWKCYLESRFFEVSEDVDNINFSMRYKRRSVNEANQDFSNERLNIEMTTDGKTWTTIKEIKGNEPKEGAWSSLFFEIPKPDSKYYRLRINAIGSGQTHLTWLIDDVSVNQALNPENPTGLRVLNQDEKEGLKLGWHNELGLHQLSYLENSPIVWDYNVGNEGKPMLVAVDFTPAETAPFEGEYISGLSAFLFDDPEIAKFNSTSAEGIVYEDGVEVARAQIYSDFQRVSSSTAWFNAPVKIEPGKTYRAAVRIFDYPAEQAPIYYQAGLSMKPGLTDLFSEDEGATWSLASEALADSEGRGNVIWPIRLLVQEDAAPADNMYDFENWVNYTLVYRNGELLDNVNYYDSHPYMVDPKPLEEAEYSLRQFTVDGRASEMSEPLLVKFTKVEEAFADIDASFTLDRKAGEINATSNVTGMVVTDLQGRRVAAVNGAKMSVNGLSGLHILTLKTQKGTKSYKIIL